MALVSGRQECGKGELLAAVSAINVHLEVVNANAVVGVARGDCDLHTRRQEIWGGGGVEAKNGDVLEDEMGFGGAENCPYDEDYNAHDDGQGEEDGGEAAEELLVVVVVVAAVLVLGAHFRKWVVKQGKKEGELE